MKKFTLNLKSSIQYLLFYTLLLGIVYPFTMTLLSHIFMKEKSEGSLLYKDSKVIGSKLIAQKFDCKKYFCTRASAADFATIPSGASNLSPTSKTPLTLASGSGLDPEITLESAHSQLPLVASSRKLKNFQIESLKEDLKKLTISPTL
jgi:K+-transporting ATPase ATPase C chain